MCYTAIIPTITMSAKLNADLLNLTYVFNRWLKMLTSYGQLDKTSLNKDFTVISKVIKGTNIKKTIKNAVAKKAFK